MITIDDFLEKVNDGELKRRPISEEEWEEIIFMNIDLYRQQIRQAQGALQNILDIYQTYLFEKEKYRIEFFEENGEVVYEKHKRGPIGFKPTIDSKEDK